MSLAAAKALASRSASALDFTYGELGADGSVQSVSS